jgi:hypothetical protein
MRVVRQCGASPRGTTTLTTCVVVDLLARTSMSAAFLLQVSSGFAFSLEAAAGVPEDRPPILSFRLSFGSREGSGC